MTVKRVLHLSVRHLFFKGGTMKKDTMNNREAEGRALALLPIGVFLVIFLGAGILFNDFYAMPAIVAFLIALFVAFLQNRKVSFDEKVRIIASGLGEENIITMCLIFLCAGGFSGAVTAAGGVDSTVALGLSLIPAKFVIAGLFVIACFISVSMGTSMGTIAALAPIAVGISEATDSVTIIVSEETGQVSVAQDGRLMRNVTASELREILEKAQNKKIVDNNKLRQLFRGRVRHEGKNN